MTERLDVEDTQSDPVGVGERDAEQIRAEIEQTRGELGDTVEALAAKTDLKAQAHETIATAKHGVADNVSNAKQAITGKRDEFAAKAKEVAPESMGEGAQQLRTRVDEDPLPFAVGGAFFAGLAAGWLLRRR